MSNFCGVCCDFFNTFTADHVLAQDVIVLYVCKKLGSEWVNID